MACAAAPPFAGSAWACRRSCRLARGNDTTAKFAPSPACRTPTSRGGGEAGSASKAARRSSSRAVARQVDNRPPQVQADLSTGPMVDECAGEDGVGYVTLTLVGGERCEDPAWETAE